MSTKTSISVEDYLMNEATAEQKSEYDAGEVRMMSGASWNHNVIVSRLIAKLTQCLEKKGCLVLPSDLLVHIPECEKFVYPDVTVVCDKPQLKKHPNSNLDALLNPTIIVEVLSESTQLRDRTEKFDCYKKMSSLKEYVLVDSKKKQIEIYHRQANGWLLNTANEKGDTIDIMGCNIALEDVYYGVEFEENVK